MQVEMGTKNQALEESQAAQKESQAALVDVRMQLELQKEERARDNAKAEDKQALQLKELLVNREKMFHLRAEKIKMQQLIDHLNADMENHKLGDCL